MAPSVLVIGEGRAADWPEGRLVAPQARPDLFQHRRRNSDVDDPKVAASPEALERVVPRLAAEEGDSELSAGRTAHDQATIAVQAARHVDGDNRQRATVHLSDHDRRHAFNLARKA